jgi:hypothetical protein
VAADPISWPEVATHLTGLVLVKVQPASAIVLVHDGGSIRHRTWRR